MMDALLVAALVSVAVSITVIGNTVEGVGIATSLFTAACVAAVVFGRLAGVFT